MKKNTPPVVEVTESDLEEIARLVQDGNTSGSLNDGEGKNISWEIKIDCWQD